MFRIAHVTDPHFRSFEGARVQDFFNKRAVGTANLLLYRRRKHKMELLAALGEELRVHKPDHLVLTGDLANVALQAEWREALRWLEAFAGPPAAVTVIPGNHDTYIEEVVRSGLFERMFAPYQSADLRADGHTYPFVRLRGECAFFGVNTCVPTNDLGGWGEIGAAQRARLEALLGAPGVAGRLRIVLVHHPPVMQRGGESRNLRDRAPLVDLLRRAGADLVLHGHDHRDERATIEGPAGARIPVVGAGSASYAGSAERRSRFNVYEIDARRVTAVTWAHDEATGRYREARREAL